MSNGINAQVLKICIECGREQTESEYVHEGLTRCMRPYGPFDDLCMGFMVTPTSPRVCTECGCKEENYIRGNNWCRKVVRYAGRYLVCGGRLEYPKESPKHQVWICSSCGYPAIVDIDSDHSKLTCGCLVDCGGKTAICGGYFVRVSGK